MKTKQKKYAVWFFSEEHLEDIGEKLVEKGIIQSFDYDYENVYEWMEAEATNVQAELNFSRQHAFHEDNGLEQQRKSNKENPVSVLFMYDDNEPSDEEVEQFASALSKVLENSCFLGKINYLGEDEYEYIQTKEITQ